MVGKAPATGTTTACTRSPHLPSGTRITAHVATAGCWATAFSTSNEYTFSPPAHAGVRWATQAAVGGSAQVDPARRRPLRPALSAPDCGATRALRNCEVVMDDVDEFVA